MQQQHGHGVVTTLNKTYGQILLEDGRVVNFCRPSFVSNGKTLRVGLSVEVKYVEEHTGAHWAVWLTNC